MAIKATKVRFAGKRVKAAIKSGNATAVKADSFDDYLSKSSRRGSSGSGKQGSGS